MKMPASHKGMTAAEHKAMMKKRPKKKKEPRFKAKRATSYPSSPGGF